MNTLPATSATPISLKVRMEPYLVESICELSRFVQNKSNLHTGLSGLLFGRADQGTRTVEALKTFADFGARSDLARRERLERAYISALAEAKNDAELAALDVVGWFSFRNGGGLLSGDVVFHNQHFRKAEDLALIVWREGPSQVTVEFYSKSDNNTTLTPDDYRWSSVRLSADIRHIREPVELAMRGKPSDDSVADKSDELEPRFAGLRRKVESVNGKLFGSRHKPEALMGNAGNATGERDLPSRASWAPEAALDGMSNVAAAAAAAGAFTAMSGARTAPALNDDRRSDPAIPPAFPQPRISNISGVGHTPRSRRADQAELSGLPMLFKPQAPAGKPFPWLWTVVLFVSTSAAVFAFLLFGGLETDGGRIGQALHGVFRGGDLNLRVGTDDDRLRLTWNQHNPAVTGATDGNLQIFDGPEHREVHLDGRQVADGLVLYRPLTNDVTFRLNVRGPQGVVTGSVRVLDGLGDRQPLDVSAPRGGESGQQNPSRNVPNGSPTVIRPDAAAVSRSASADTPVITLPHMGRPGPARRYEPAKGAAPDSPASTINGWETSRSKSGAKAAASFQAAKPGPSGAGFIGPRPLLQVMPRTSAIPSDTIQSRTRVEVQVRIDPDGKVSSAHVVGSAVNQTIAAAALAAARQWTFVPATNSGQHVESEHTIVFEFRPQR